LGAIAGLISKLGGNVTAKIIEMLTEMKHRGLDSACILINNEVKLAEKPDEIDLDGLVGHTALGNVQFAISGKETCSQPLGDCTGKLRLIVDGEIDNDREIKLSLLNHHFHTMVGNEAIVHLVEKNYVEDLVQAIRASQPHLVGAYAFAIYNGEEIVAARDPVGVKPLYFGETHEFAGFASERKALWKLGVRDVKALTPGGILRVSKEGCQISEGTPLVRPAVKIFTADEAAFKLKESLCEAVRRKLRGFQNVAVAFSGGVDSAIIAKLIAALGVKVTLYTVGFEGSYDVIAATQTAKNLDLNHVVRLLTLKDVEEYLPRVIYALEDADPMKVEVGLPLFVVAERAQSDGIRVVFSGQGSDELFGGYSRYLRVLEEYGYDGLQDRLWQDILEISEVNLQRDEAVTMANGIELKVPFLDVNVIHVAMTIHPALKIQDQTDKLRKRILRKTAEMLEIPVEVGERPKKAVQYGSGVSKAFKRLAVKNGYKRVDAYLKAIFDQVFGNAFQRASVISN
jgi:asparagine synthase (glutamine-hydrolysing)